MRRNNGRVAKSFHLGTSAEAKFKALAEERGWLAYRRGWPDFLLKADGKLEFVEVKATGDRLSLAQVDLFTALESSGITVRIWWESAPKKLMPWRKFHSIQMERLRAEHAPSAPTEHTRSRRRNRASEQRLLARHAWIDRELGRH